MALDDFDFSPVVSEFHHMTENITQAIQEIIECVDAVLQEILFLFSMNIIPFPFLLSYEALHGLVDWKPKRKSYQHMWCYSFNYRQLNTQIESSTVAIILYAAAALCRDQFIASV